MRAIAAVHDFLSHTQSAMTVSAREVVRRLVPMAAQTANISATWEADDATLTVQQGTALALSLNELVSNAGKHGGGSARVTLTRDGAACELTVLDDGPGFPPGFDPARSANQGLDLLATLAGRDLRGSLHFDTPPEGGGRVRVRFPVAE